MKDLFQFMLAVQVARRRPRVDARARCPTPPARDAPSPSFSSGAAFVVATPSSELGDRGRRLRARAHGEARLTRGRSHVLRQRDEPRRAAIVQPRAQVCRAAARMAPSPRAGRRRTTRHTPKKSALIGATSSRPEQLGVVAEQARQQVGDEPRVLVAHARAAAVDDDRDLRAGPSPTPRSRRVELPAVQDDAGALREGTCADSTRERGRFPGNFPGTRARASASASRRSSASPRARVARLAVGEEDRDRPALAVAPVEPRDLLDLLAPPPRAAGGRQGGRRNRLLLLDADRVRRRARALAPAPPPPCAPRRTREGPRRAGRARARRPRRAARARGITVAARRASAAASTASPRRRAATSFAHARAIAQVVVRGDALRAPAVAARRARREQRREGDARAEPRGRRSRGRRGSRRSRARSGRGRRATAEERAGRRAAARAARAGKARG